MELYELRATINNTAETFTFEHIPENFEGVQISQKFSFINPMGYTPKFSVETMRAVLGDKTKLDEVFFNYGLQSDVEIEIWELNDSGIGYTYKSAFAVDFESYLVEDVYSEFALKSISVIDKYNEVKNTEMQFSLPLRSNVNGSRAYLPNSQSFMNSVSVKNKGYFDDGANNKVLRFEKNNESKIYNDDTALFTNDITVYRMGVNGFSSDIVIRAQIEIEVFAASNFDYVFVSIIKNHNGQLTSHNLTQYFGEMASSHVVSGVFEITIPAVGQANTFLNVYVTTPPSAAITDIRGNIFMDLFKTTGVKIIGEKQYIKFNRLPFILEELFGENVSGANLSSVNFTSANCIMGMGDFAIAKPKEILSDAAKMLGLAVNFKLNGSVDIRYISDYFDILLNASNAINVIDYKDLTVKYSNEINFKSVNAGTEQSEYDLYTYLIDWNKTLSFSQNRKNASEVLDLAPSKLRSDFSGIIDYFYKKTLNTNKASKDLFLYNFETKVSDSGAIVYDAFTPRDILQNWRKFLSFCFQNFGQDTLTVSSNGGTNDNLSISGVAQMDDLVLNETPRLLPIEYNFTALIDDIDFSEHILKINHNEQDVYLFVIEATTTDTLSEQQIRGLKIQF